MAPFASLTAQPLAAMPIHSSSLELLESRIAPAALLVTSAADSGAGSLRDTINGSHSGDVISFKLPAGTKIITLTSGQIVIDHALTINGPGAGNLVINGNAHDRIFSINDNHSDIDIAVALNGLSFVNGHTGFFGGAILSAENLTISNSVLSGNSAGAGGAIMEFGSTLGAGLLLMNTQIVNNSASGGGGGGVGFVSFGSFEALGCFIANNTATSDGGGLSLFVPGNGVGDVYVVSSVISHNSSSSGQGGGVYFDNGRTGADGVTHTADDGAAEIYGSLVTSNTAATAGGGVSFNAGRGIIISSMLKGNSAPQGGGGTTNAATDTLVITGSSFQQNHASDASGQGGGALFLATPTLGTVTAKTTSGTGIGTTEFVGNQSASNGGAIKENGTALVLNLTSFRQNVAANNGGGIYAADENSSAARLVAYNSEFLANSATTATGGAISYYGSAPISLTMLSMMDDTSGSGGGALAVLSTSTVTLHSIAATGNAAGLTGGALNVNTTGMVEFDFLLLKGNSSVVDGGALFLLGASSVTMDHAIISGNTAKGNGGGIANLDRLNMATTQIYGNIAGGSAGGVYTYGVSGASFNFDPTSVLIAGNTAVDGVQFN